MRRLRERFGQEILFHMEFMKKRPGARFPAPSRWSITLPKTSERDDRLIAARSVVFVANPHVEQREGGGRYRADNVQLLAKQRYDPEGLLNPGKMVTFQPEAAVAETATTR